MELKIILCEKPLSLSFLEAKKIINKANHENVNIIINHMRRFSPLINEIRNYIQNNYIQDTLVGTIISGIAFYDKGLFHCGTHILDLLVYFFGKFKGVTQLTQANSHDINDVLQSYTRI